MTLKKSIESGQVMADDKVKSGKYNVYNNGKIISCELGDDCVNAEVWSRFVFRFEDKSFFLEAIGQKKTANSRRTHYITQHFTLAQIKALFSALSAMIGCESVLDRLNAKGDENG